MTLTEAMSLVREGWNAMWKAYFNFLVYLMRWCMNPDTMEALKVAGIAIVVWVVLYAGRNIGLFRFLMRWLQRIIVFIGLCLLGVWLFYTGREHQIFLDNRTLGEYSALEQVNVSVNGEKYVELMSRERDMRKAVGPKAELKAEVFDEDGNIVNTITKTLELEFSKDVMISLPALAGGNEEFIVPAPR